MNLLLVIATDEQAQLENALRGHLSREFPGEVHEIDTSSLPPLTTGEEDDVAMARDLLVADAVVMLLPLVHEQKSMRCMRSWMHRAGVDGVTVMVEPDGITGILDEKPVFLIRPTQSDIPSEEEEEPVRFARTGLANLGLHDITVINVDPDGHKMPLDSDNNPAHLN